MSDAREPLILVPGLLCDAALWAPQIAALGATRAIQVAETTLDESVDAMAARLLADAPPRFALAGLSMGGYVAQAVLRAAPERVTRAALLDTSARADTPEQTERRRALIRLSEMGRFKGVTPKLMPLLIHPARMDDAALTGTVYAMAERVGQAAFTRQQKAIWTRPDNRPHLGRIRCPALVLCGADDALTPPELARELAEAMPDARLVLVPECGHLSTLERPDAVTTAMAAWLAAG